jgi:predicted kinase
MSETLKSFIHKLSKLQPVDLNHYRQTLHNEFAELQHMSNCAQDSVWHTEGNVLAHTQMVMDKVLSEIANNPTLSRKEQISTYLTALLHDVGKPTTTYALPNNRLVSPGYINVGLPIAKRILFLLKTPFDIQEHVLRLILRQGTAYRMAKRIVPDLTFNGINVEQKKYFRLASELSLPSLYHFTRANWLGRIGTNIEQTLDLLGVFRSRAEHHTLWNSSYYSLLNTVVTFEDLSKLGVKDSKEQKRIQYLLFNLTLRGKLQTRKQALEYINNKKEILSPNMAHLYIMVGVPGSGKSTWVENNLPNAVLVSSDKKREELFNDVHCQADNKRVFIECHADLRRALEAGKEVVFDATNTKFNYRNLAVQLAFEYFAHTTIVYFDLPVEIALERNRQRSRYVSEDIITRFFNELEVPRFTEAQELKIISPLPDPAWE